MPDAGLHERLAGDRRFFERLILSRMGSTMSPEDAEDIVSDSLLRLQASPSTRQPAPGKETSWFASIVVNQGFDFLRARDGRRRPGSLARPMPVAFDDVDEEELEQFGIVAAPPSLDALADEAERRHVRELVVRVMTSLEPAHAELIRLRLKAGPQATRSELAAMAGLSVGEFRWRYARAWGRFVQAVAADAPTPRCQPIRQLLGEVEAGTASSNAAAEIDAHTLDCASCRVFARESYRALELFPLAPAVGLADRWSYRAGAWWERGAPEATTGAGTAAAAAGLWGLLGGGGAAGALKALAIVCSVSAVTAGVCAGVIAVIEESSKSPTTTTRQARRTPTPRPTATPPPAAAKTPAPTPEATVAPPPRRASASRDREQPTSVDTSGESPIPGPAPDGASEFTPSASSASVDPAPAPIAGGGEFSP
jgi:DNA-directed RNA polymerase specialized sigma24 family protein